MITFKTKRRQLTLFLSDNKSSIEYVRKLYNPIQFDLIPAHVTLCREGEIENLSKVIHNINKLSLKEPLQVHFSKPKRFDEGKGVLLPSEGLNLAFHKLRAAILKGVVSKIRDHQPHITLMHPRNSNCTDEILELINTFDFLSVHSFTKIELIEQTDGGLWKCISSYPFMEK